MNPGESPDSRAGRDRAIVLIDRSHNRQVVVACCAVAGGCGVRTGMTLAHARAMLADADAIVEPLEPARDRKALDALAQWAMRFSPLVQVDDSCAAGQGGLLIDVTGCQRFFGGEENLLKEAYRAGRQLGLTVRLGLADTIGCAWAMARYAKTPVTLVASGAHAAAMEPLPVEALRLDSATIGSLAHVGLRKVAHVLPLPPAALRQRFGDLLLLRIDQAMGRVWECVDPVGPLALPHVSLTLGGPICDLEAIKLGVRNLLKKLLAGLAAQSLGVRHLEVVLGRSDVGPLPLQIPLAYPSCDEKHLWTLLGPSLEKANLGFGVEALHLTARATAPLQYSQLPLLPQATARKSSRQMKRCLGELVDVLVSRLGSPSVCLTQAIESHLPERAFARLEAREALGRRRLAAAPAAADAKAPRPDRPSVLLDRPQSVTVTNLSPEGPLMLFSWAGRTHRVQACIGPERLSPQWWGLESRGSNGQPNDPLSSRDYYKVQDQAGQWIWLYRQRRDNRWFVHGLWQ